MPTLNHGYAYDEVSAFYQPTDSPLHWVLTRGLQIQALRLREDYNQNIFNPRAEVWVGADSPTSEWGNTLANDTAQVPVFVKRVGGDTYTYLGLFEVLTDEATAGELTAARNMVAPEHDRGVSRIVFLKTK